jgi:hypothetical protein
MERLRQISSLDLSSKKRPGGVHGRESRAETTRAAIVSRISSNSASGIVSPLSGRGLSSTSGSRQETATVLLDHIITNSLRKAATLSGRRIWPS